MGSSLIPSQNNTSFGLWLEFNQALKGVAQSVAIGEMREGFVEDKMYIIHMFVGHMDFDHRGDVAVCVEKEMSPIVTFVCVDGVAF